MIAESLALIRLSRATRDGRSPVCVCVSRIETDDAKATFPVTFDLRSSSSLSLWV